MAIKKFTELSKVEVPITKKPIFKWDKAKQKTVKDGELDTLSWVDCLSALYENGAERVVFENVPTEDGTLLYKDENGAITIKVFVDIDGDRREIFYPVIDGTKDVEIEKLTQSDIYNCPIRVFANIDNELYFGSEEGQICVFDDKYSDRTYQYSSDGDLSVYYINNQINYNKDIGIDLSEDDKITVYTEGLYACVVENATVNNGHIFLDEESILTVHDGMEVYADKVENKGLSLNKKYFIKDVDSGKCSFMLEDESGEVIENLYSGFNLCKKLSNTDLYLTNVKNESTYSFQVKDNKYGKPLTLCGYDEVTPSGLSVRFSHAKNVVAEWYTPIFDLGTNESSKTLLKMTISTEPEVNGKLSFGYETRKVNKLINARGINVFSFDNFSFENFSFDTAFANSYSVKVNERNFNFIIFRFVSDNDSNLIVNNFTVIYKINKSNIGVK